VARRGQEPLDPLDRVGGTRGEDRRGTPGRGEDDQGGGEQPRIAGSGGRIVGVQFDQPGYLLFGVPHQRHEREHLAADPRRGQQLVVMAGQVGPLVRQDCIQLAGIQRYEPAGFRCDRTSAVRAVGPAISVPSRLR
jgi:hypothetical protein